VPELALYAAGYAAYKAGMGHLCFIIIRIMSPAL
jgi:hypothetical protein